ncbi:hypothetical protein B4V02_04990 [Paenibacillus kribbensis]|uniref:Uncharacterized protein n=1 Tax=Paenibacillus kribbensis TaxID=172713 RepID=A0A222WI28_9BACL|nr:hypothetical protein B4V02_04990 [Paenibacillus kribbensis]
MQFHYKPKRSNIKATQDVHTFDFPYKGHLVGHFLSETVILYVILLTLKTLLLEKGALPR